MSACVYVYLYIYTYINTIMKYDGMLTYMVCVYRGGTRLQQTWWNPSNTYMVCDLRSMWYISMSIHATCGMDAHTYHIVDLPPPQNMVTFLTY